MRGRTLKASLTRDPLSVHRCGFCKKRLPTAAGVKLHVQNIQACRARWEEQQLQRSLRSDNSQFAAYYNSNQATYDNFMPAADPMVVDPTDGDTADASSRRASVEDVPDEEPPFRRYHSYYKGAAQVLGEGETGFEKWERESKEQKKEAWDPYSSREEWELVRFLSKNLGQNKIEEFLNLDIVSNIFSSILQTFFNVRLDREVQTHVKEQVQILPGARQAPAEHHMAATQCVSPG